MLSPLSYGAKSAPVRGADRGEASNACVVSAASTHILLAVQPTRYLAPTRYRAHVNFLQSRETAIAHLPSLKALPWD
jgi:hypothetical protein